MNKSILVGLVAIGLVGCSGGDVNDQPTDAVTAEAPVAEVAAPAEAPVVEEAPAADAEVVQPSASEPAAEPVVVQ